VQVGVGMNEHGGRGGTNKHRAGGMNKCTHAEGMNEHRGVRMSTGMCCGRFFMCTTYFNFISTS
jgi:hypothetical protein